MRRVVKSALLAALAVIEVTASFATSEENEQQRQEKSEVPLEVLIDVQPRLDAYLKTRQTKNKELAEKYGKVLDVRLNTAADAGNLKMVEAYQGEKKSLDVLKSTLVNELKNPVASVRKKLALPKLPADAPADLITLRKIWTIERQKIRSKLDGELLQSLKTLEAELTKGRELKKARFVLNYRKSLSEKTFVRADVSASQLVPVDSKIAAQLSAGRPDSEFTNGLGMEMRWILPGKFTMGSSPDEVGREGDKEMQVEVELTKTFWIGIFEVTQGEYEAVTGFNPSGFRDKGNRKPVEQVSWTEAMKFCEKLTELEQKNGKLPESWLYTLPSEAQWEYACRAGSKGPFSSRALDRVGWYKGNSSGEPKEVGQKKSNDWGLYDMHGNVREWCLNWFADKQVAGKNPVGPAGGEGRAHRGGSWLHPEEGCRSSDRDGSAAGYKSTRLGFRVVLVNFK